MKSKMRHPSSSSSSSLLPIISNDALVHSVLKLLPGAILTIVLVLPFQDREVLAYMITRSINTNTQIFPSVFTQENTIHNHKPPLFHCDCFDCYITYWLRWDSSSNRDLIHHAIDAFEKMSPEIQEWGLKAQDSPEDEVSFLESDHLVYDGTGGDCNELTQSLSLKEEEEKVEAQLPETTVVRRVGGGGGVSTHKGLARKVLPDVIGLLNWRFWSFWNLNV